MRGAGGSQGGLGEFVLGFFMMCGGFYMLLNAITVRSDFGWTMRLYRFNAFGNSVALTTGMVFIPMIFGIGIIFYDSKNILGWALSLGSLGAMIFGVISTLNITMRTMSAFDLIVILVLCFGGLGLFLRSLRAH